MTTRPNAPNAAAPHRDRSAPRDTTTSQGIGPANLAVPAERDILRDVIGICGGAVCAVVAAVLVDYALLGGPVPPAVAAAMGAAVALACVAAAIVFRRARRRPAPVATTDDGTAGHRQLLAELAAARLDADRRGREFAALEAAVRHPVADLLAVADRIGGGGLDVADAALVESLRTQARALDDRVAVLTELARLERGVATLDIVEVDLADLFERAVGARRGLARHDDVTLRLRLHPRLPRTVRADPERLWSVLGVLVDNAVRASAGTMGPRTVTVEVGAGDRAGDRVPLCVEVRDGGAGLDQTRLDALLADGDADGDGLGLRFAARLAALMGGHLSGESAIGGGTAVRLEVPVETATPAPIGGGPTAALAVAVVANNIALRRAIGWMLEGQVGWHAGVGHGGSDYNDLDDLVARDGGIDVAVVDAALGPDTIGRAAALAHQVVLLVADDTAAGDDPLAVPKPVRPGRLMDALRAASTRQRGGSDANLVVIAEDNADLQLVLAGFVAASGYDVEVCPNGRRAVDAYRNRPDDVVAVLLDCHMPLLDGFGAAREIRAHEGRCGLAPVPLVGLGASAGAADRDRASGAGMDDFLDKPLTAEAVAATLVRWASRPTAGAVPAGVAARNGARQYGSR